jgi:hypothetical protein
MEDKAKYVIRLCELKQAAGTVALDNVPSRSLGRLSLLSIPDLIRDPEEGTTVHLKRS